MPWTSRSTVARSCWHPVLDDTVAGIRHRQAVAHCDVPLAQMEYRVRDAGWCHRIFDQPGSWNARRPDRFLSRRNILHRGIRVAPQPGCGHRRARCSRSVTGRCPRTGGLPIAGLRAFPALTAVDRGRVRGRKKAARARDAGTRGHPDGRSRHQGGHVVVRDAPDRGFSRAQSTPRLLRMSSAEAAD
jgi:hypothetical protein